MKQDIHPEYKKATIKCACGQEFEVGSTKDDINIEICSNCHPFYTGEEQLVDTAGRAEKFEQRRKKAQEARSQKEQKEEEKEKEKEKKADEDEIVKEAKEKIEN